MLATLVTFLFFVFHFFRQVRIDRKPTLEYRQNDQHILREIEKFKNSKE